MVLLLPWVAAIVSRTGSSFFADFIGHDMLGKVAEGQDPMARRRAITSCSSSSPSFPQRCSRPWPPPAPGRCGASPGCASCWPGSSRPGSSSNGATKLPHYVLPLYPAIAILIAEAVDSGKLSRNRWLVLGTIGWFLIPLILCGLAIAGLVYFTGALGLLAWPFALAAAALGYLAWRRYEVEGAEAALLRASAASIFMGIAVAGIALPAMSPAIPSVELTRLVEEAGCPHPMAASVGYDQPSLVFLLGTATKLTDPFAAVDFLKEGGCRFAFVNSTLEFFFNKQAQKLGLHFRRGPVIEGLNYDKGRWVSMVVFRPAAVP